MQPLGRAEGAGQAPRDSQARRRAPVTRALIWANVAAFALQLAVVRSFDALRTMPSSAMLALGACDAYATAFDVRPETLITSCFLHFSILHLATNMAVLAWIGPRLEAQVGSARFAVLYGASAVAASAGSVAVSVLVVGDDHLSAGASGGICGVLAATVVLGARIEGWKGPMVRASAPLLVFIAMLGIQARALQIDNAAHATGACTGALVALRWRRGVRIEPSGQRAVLVACTAICAIAVVANALRVTVDPNAARDATARYEHAVAALSARRCDEARRDVRAAARLAPDARELGPLREAIARHCGDERAASEPIKTRGEF